MTLVSLKILVIICISLQILVNYSLSYPNKTALLTTSWFLGLFLVLHRWRGSCVLQVGIYGPAIFWFGICETDFFFLTLGIMTLVLWGFFTLGIMTLDLWGFFTLKIMTLDLSFLFLYHPIAIYLDAKWIKLLMQKKIFWNLLLFCLLH